MARNAAAPSVELRAFLHGETVATSFRHADHVRVAFEILRRHEDVLEAANVYASALKTIAARAGNAGAYHATITLASLALIAERMAECPCERFEDFANAHRDLLDKRILDRWYAPQRLQSAAARTNFILPDAAR